MATPGATAYKLFVPKQTVGASLVYFDLFVATTSNVRVIVKSVLPIVSTAVAVTGVVGVDLHLQYTSAIGTGGTAATANGTDIAAATITALSLGASKLDGGITARLTPSGGATAGALIAYTCVMTEELGATYLGNPADLVARNPMSEPITLVAGFGLRVAQGTVASVGTIGFEVLFETIPLP